MKKFVLFCVTCAAILIPSFSLQGGRTPSGVVRTTSATEPAGIRLSTWIFSSNFSGTVLGVSFPASTSIDIDAHPGETLNGIPYTITAGSITIIEIR